MTEYSNGACGACIECGSETEEEWHAYCSDCYAQEQGWGTSTRPDTDALQWQHEDRAQVVITRLLARVDELEIRIGRLERGMRAT